MDLIILKPFHVYLYANSISQWRSTPLYDSINYFPISFISEFFVGMINDTAISSPTDRYIQTRIYGETTLDYMTVINARPDDSFEFMVIGI